MVNWFRLYIILSYLTSSYIIVSLTLLVDPLPGVETNSSLVTWLHGYLITWLPGYLVTWLPGYLVSWLPGQLVSGLLVDRLAGYLVGSRSCY